MFPLSHGGSSEVRLADVGELSRASDVLDVSENVDVIWICCSSCVSGVRWFLVEHDGDSKCLVERLQSEAVMGVHIFLATWCDLENLRV